MTSETRTTRLITRVGVLGVLVFVALLAAPGAATLSKVQAAAHGPAGRYYVTDESGFNKVWQFQGSTLTSFPTAPSGGADGPILVDGNTSTVRSVKGGFGGGSAPVLGSEYNFAGVVQGPLALDFSAHAGYGRVIDAAFDGTNAYIVAGLFGSAGVFRYNADFSGPGVLLFNILNSPQNTAQGITYDTTTNTIWTSDYDFSATATGGRVRQWSLAGVELFSFPVVDNAGNASERNTALAYDFTDDTFWMNAHVETALGFGQGELWQFSRAGTFLQKIHAQQFDPSAPANLLYWGGEIRATGASFGDTDEPEEEEEAPNCIPGIPGFSCGGQRGGGVSDATAAPQPTVVAQPTQSAAPSAPAPTQPSGTIAGVISPPDTGTGPERRDRTATLMVIVLTAMIGVGALATGIARRR